MRLSPEDQAEIAKLRKELAAMREELHRITDQRDEALTSVKLSDEIVTLREKLVEAQIDRSRQDEEHARKTREVEHATGLLRRQAEWEQTKAVQEAQLAVREENLSADRKRFEEQMEFHRDQIADEMSRFEGLLKSLMERLPTVNVEAALSGNGHQ